MLLEFIAAHHADLVERTRTKIAKRLGSTSTEEEIASGVPLFLDQLVETLRRTSSTSAAMDRAAAQHGASLLGLGYTVAQVVHDYGDICQALTELAMELDAPITTDEFHMLNMCLDNAISEAVTEYTRLSTRAMADAEIERSGVFAHELRNRISAVQLAYQTIASGRAPIGGSVALLVTRNLQSMTALVNRALIEVRVDAGNTCRERIRLSELVASVEVEGMLEAAVHLVSLTVGPVDPELDVEADPLVLAGVLSNLLQNAFKFTRWGGSVSLRTSAADGRVRISVEDECGGLPPGKVDQLFGAFRQRGADRTGLGLGLFISRKGIEASGGTIDLRDLPGHGCVFTIDLPLATPGAPSS